MIDFLQLDNGGTLYHTMVDIPATGARWDASPAPAVVLKNGSGGTIKASAAATLGPTTTLAAAAAAKATSITLTSASGISRFDRLVIGPNASGQWEWVTVDAPAASGGVVLILDPLEHAYAIAAVVKSHTMSLSVAAAYAGSLERHCRAEWTYTVGSVVRTESTQYVVSRYAPRLSVTPADLMQHEPRARKLIGSNQQLEILIRQIWEGRVLPDVAKLYGSPGAIPSGETLRDCLLAKFDAHVARRIGAYEAEIRYESLYSELLDELRVGMIDTNEDGSVEPEAIRTSRVARVWRG